MRFVPPTIAYDKISMGIPNEMALVVQIYSHQASTPGKPDGQRRDWRSMRCQWSYSDPWGRRTMTVCSRACS